jgi:hypothetical protein
MERKSKGRYARACRLKSFFSWKGFLNIVTNRSVDLRLNIMPTSKNSMNSLRRGARSLLGWWSNGTGPAGVDRSKPTTTWSETLSLTSATPLARLAANPNDRASRSLGPTERAWLVGCLAAAAVFHSYPAGAQLPVARIAQVFPPGGKTGSTFDVTVAGSDLEDAVKLQFSHSGVTAESKGGNQFAVTIASNTPPGVYEVRFLGRFGLSNPRAFVVGSRPESTVSNTNGSPASASGLAVDTTVNGRVEANSVAWFKFSAKKGQRLFLECEAEAIDSRLDPVLTVLNSAGHELERARTTGLVDFLAPGDGVFLLKLHDFLYRGGGDQFYRLTLSSGPRLDFIVPAAGLPGSKTNYTVYGRNLPGSKPVKGQSIDGKPLEQLTVEISIPADKQARRLNTGLLIRPATAALDGFDYRLTTPKGVSNPFLLGIATAPVLLEAEPNNKPSAAQTLNPPCEVTGDFSSPTDQDWYTFQAKKGDVLWIEVFSQRLGFGTDPFVLVQKVGQDAKGQATTEDVLELADSDTNLGDREFNTISRDPVGRFEAKEDGTYRLLVRDLFIRAENASRPLYRLSVRRETPDFRLVAMTLVPRFKADAKNIGVGVPLLRRGETIALKVLAFRRDGFNGDIELAIEEPPAGLIFAGDRIEAGKSSTFILLTAAEDAPAFAGPLRLVGRARVGEKELVRDTRGGTLTYAVGNIDNERPKARLAREFTLAISAQETAPISIYPSEKKQLEAAANAKLKVPLQITRRADFNATFKLKPLGPGNQDALKEIEVDGKATNATLTLDFGALKLAPGTYIFAAQTQTTGKYRDNPEAAAFAEAAAKEADKTAGELAAAAKKAGEEFAAAEKAAGEAETAAKLAAEKLATATAALQKAPEDAKLAAERDSVSSAATAATEKSKASQAAKEKAAHAKTAAEAKSAEAKTRKETAAARAKEMSERAKPKDATIQVQSAPIYVKLTPVEQAKSK